jgi:hypothetical protein
VAGGVLLFFAMVGALALPVLACELALRAIKRRRDREAEAAAIVRHRLHGHPPPDTPCLWPRLEPEVERLREKGAL